MPDSPAQRPRRVPPYLLVADELTAEIHAGTYDTGEPFPSESMLAARFGRALMTIRRSLEVLRERGLITTEWGRGSWVVPADQRPALGAN
ncbi:GntR family transcriptional regulator [Kitasatospora xanthocidica]|uniref:GntR family transcriptional regulator n=1 Tax=Kitasatospora xanthocidica TaxID=83382 RepID=UPI0036F039CB